jgi:hypothetical protein
MTENVPVSCWMMGRCPCFRLDDGKMFLLLLIRKMCRVLLEEGKMWMGRCSCFLLDDWKMFLFPAG